MAGPQLKDGYTQLAHKILEDIGQYGLNGTQRGIIDQVWRYTYGFKRKEHALSIGFLAKALNKSKSHIDRELNVLIERNVIQVVADEPNRTRVLRFNKDFDSWGPVVRRTRRSPPLLEETDERSAEMASIPYKEIIDYLNAKAGTRFSHQSKPTQKHISGRFSEKRKLEDFIHVIDVKCAHWLGDPKMEQYLRPSTLFAPKNFENYLNQTEQSGNAVKLTAFDKNKELLLGGRESDLNDTGRGEVHSLQGFGSLPEYPGAEGDDSGLD